MFTVPDLDVVALTEQHPTASQSQKQAWLAAWDEACTATQALNEEIDTHRATQHLYNEGLQQMREIREYKAQVEQTFIEMEHRQKSQFDKMEHQANSELDKINKKFDLVFVRYKQFEDRIKALQSMVAVRDEKIIKLEGELTTKDAIIEQLKQRLRANNLSDGV
ncbi:hypothetical protein IL306_009974 [Fusarium sp. DS 682]|nr:hypothetical protein IL306_009974 [Fusarium sp. DS 682]